MILEKVENHEVREELFKNKVLKKDTEIEHKERKIIKDILLIEINGQPVF